jgi:hypothetical protein
MAKEKELEGLRNQREMLKAKLDLGNASPAQRLQLLRRIGSLDLQIRDAQASGTEGQS